MTKSSSACTSQVLATDPPEHVEGGIREAEFLVVLNGSLPLERERLKLQRLRIL